MICKEERKQQKEMKKDEVVVGLSDLALREVGAGLLKWRRGLLLIRRVDRGYAMTAVRVGESVGQKQVSRKEKKRSEVRTGGR